MPSADAGVGSCWPSKTVKGGAKTQDRMEAFGCCLELPSSLCSELEEEEAAAAAAPSLSSELEEEAAAAAAPSLRSQLEEEAAAAAVPSLDRGSDGGASPLSGKLVIT